MRFNFRTILGADETFVGQIYLGKNFSVQAVL